MNERLEMPLEQFAEAVAKENARLTEEIERLKATQHKIIEAWDFWQSQETRSGFSELCASIWEAKE